MSATLSSTLPNRAARLPSAWAAWGALGGFLCAEFALVLLAAAKPSPVAVTPGRFDEWVAGPFEGLAREAIGGPMSYRWAFAGLILLMGVCYAILASLADQFPGRRAVVAVAVAGVLIVLGPPLRMSDAFNYLDFARLGVLHELNPYVHAPADVVHDPFLKFVSWRRQPTSYGPLFTLMTYPLALLGVTAAIWTLKAVTVAAGVGAATLLGACAEKLGKSPSRAVLLLGLNPVVLVYGMGGVHNDFFMTLGLVAAIHLVLTGRARAAGWGAVVAVGLKASAALMAPFVALGSRRRGQTALWMILTAVVVGVLTLLVFGHRAPGLTEQQATVTRFSVPHVIASALGHGAYRSCPDVFTCATPATQWGATAVLAVGMVGLLAWAWRGGDWITAAGWAAILVVVTLTAVMPWYLLWVLPFAILSRSRALHVATRVLAGYLLFTTQPFLPLIPYVDHHIVALVR